MSEKKCEVCGVSIAGRYHNAKFCIPCANNRNRSSISVAKDYVMLCKELVSRDAEIERLREGWMRAECEAWQLAVNNPPLMVCDECVMPGSDEHGYCKAVTDTVSKGDNDA